MSFYSELFWLGAKAVTILAMCYVIIKIVVGKELEKSVPSQIKAAQDLFKGKPVRLIVTINSKGEASLDHFEMVQGIDYAR